MGLASGQGLRSEANCSIRIVLRPDYACIAGGPIVKRGVARGATSGIGRIVRLAIAANKHWKCARNAD